MFAFFSRRYQSLGEIVAGPDRVPFGEVAKVALLRFIRGCLAENDDDDLHSVVLRPENLSFLATRFRILSQLVCVVDNFFCFLVFFH